MSAAWAIAKMREKLAVLENFAGVVNKNPETRDVNVQLCLDIKF